MQRGTHISDNCFVINMGLVDYIVDRGKISKLQILNYYLQRQSHNYIKSQISGRYR